MSSMPAFVGGLHSLAALTGATDSASGPYRAFLLDPLTDSSPSAPGGATAPTPSVTGCVTALVFKGTLTSSGTFDTETGPAFALVLFALARAIIATLQV